MSYGKTIELFLVNGTADSLTTAELSNWNGKAIKIPRIEIASCDRSDLKQPGVYFLFCHEDDGTDSVYIGEAENIKERLMQHLRDYQSEKEKYYWTTAVIFIGRDLNKALIRYLENRFVGIAKIAKRYTILTKNTYHNTVIKESQKASMEEFIANVKVLINTLGYKVLEPIAQSIKNESANDQILELSQGNATAKGKVTSEGFVVFEGATINERTSSSLAPSLIKLRKKYLSDGHIIDLKTTQDILFSSSSAAAAFLSGYSISGPNAWKSKDGRSLKDIENGGI